MLTLQPITPAVAAAFKAVRLNALLDSPSAFGSTHSKEVQLSDTDWQDRAAQWNSNRSIGYLAIRALFKLMYRRSRNARSSLRNRRG